jgi:hypothetical protein
MAVIGRMAPGKAFIKQVDKIISLGNAMWHSMCRNGLKLPAML